MTRVFVRVRPCDADGSNKRCMVRAGQQLELHNREKHRVFSFEHIFGENSSQRDVYDAIAKPMVERCVSGFNACILVYDQMNGGNRAGESSRMIPRTLNDLFAQICDDSGATSTFTCRVSYLEIYNERVRDLLADDCSNSSNLRVREDPKAAGVYVENLREEEVTSAAEAFHWLQHGIQQRKTCSTAMNKASSRSHSIFTLHLTHIGEEDIVGVPGVSKKRHETRSRLQLVDLAGSERQRKTCTKGQRIKEASAINASLTQLGLVVNALSQQERNTFPNQNQDSPSEEGEGRSLKIQQKADIHVNYRSSLLTWLLRNSLAGNAHTSLCAMVSPHDEHAHETLSTLLFAERASGICSHAARNCRESLVEESDSDDEDDDYGVLEDEMKRLRASASWRRALKLVSMQRIPFEIRGVE